MAFAVKAKGQDENVVSTHLFFRLLTKFSIVISGIRMKSPSPTVVWSAITAAAGNHSMSTTNQHNCPTVTQVCTQWTALVAVPPGLEPWQLLGRVVAAAVLQPAPSHWRAAHRRCCFNRHDPAPLNIYINVLILAVLILKIIVDISKMILISFSLLHEDRKVRRTSAISTSQRHIFALSSSPS